VTNTEALTKLKNYWVSNNREDYLKQLHKLRKDVPANHKSYEALMEEIKAVEKVHARFKRWTETKVAENLLREARKKGK